MILQNLGLNLNIECTGLYAISGVNINSCYIKTSTMYCSGVNITSKADFPCKIYATSGILNHTTSSSIDTYLYSNNLFLNNSTINHTGIGNFLAEDSIFDKFAYINGVICLYTNSIGSVNNGTIISNYAIFSGLNTANRGYVSGYCIFQSGAHNYGNISGLAIFMDGCINYGVVDQAKFSNAINNGLILNNSVFINNSINSGVIKATTSFDNSKNDAQGVINGPISIFNNFSINNGTIRNNEEIYFLSNSLNTTQGSIIDSDIVVFNSGINNGTVSNTKSSVEFYNNSSNGYDGTVYAPLIYFYNDSLNYGLLDSNNSGVFTFYDFSTNHGKALSVGTTTKFYNKSKNMGEAFSGIFYNETTNSNILNYGNFYNNSTNDGFIIDIGLFYDNSFNNSYSNNNLYFCNNTTNFGAASNLVFRDTSKNYGSGIYASFFNSSRNALSGIPSYLSYANFFDSSINTISGIVITGNYHFANFYNKSINFAEGKSGILFSFYNQSINSGICSQAIFSGLSKNINYVSSGTFRSRSFNDTKGSGHNLYFYDYSYNKGYIENSGYFYNNSTNDNLSFASGALFTDYSVNKSSFLPPSAIFLYENPIIKFSGYSKNYGTIIDSYVSFEDNSINYSNISYGTSIVFNDSGIFYKDRYVDQQNKIDHYSSSKNLIDDTNEFLNDFYNCNIPIRGLFSSLKYREPLCFKNKSINYGNIKGYYSYFFTDEATNYGNLSCFPVVPKLHQLVIFSGISKTSRCYNFADILDGKSIFINSVNSGQTLYPYFDNSVNYRNILGNTATDLVYSPLCPALSGFSGVYFIKSTNYGQSKIYTNFNESNNYGNIFNASDFIDNSVNYAFIANSANFIYSNNINGDIGGNITMHNGFCLGANIRGNAYFTDSNYISKDFYSAYRLYPFEYSLRNTSWNGQTYDKYNLYSIISRLNNDWQENDQLLQNLTTQNFIKDYAIFNNSNNYGGLLNTASFYNGKNFGIIKNSVIFENNSINAYGSKLEGSSVFIYSVNFGEINTTNFNIDYTIGNTNFYQNVYINNLQNNYPAISGELDSNQYGAIFISSTNSGTINTPSIFDHSTNTYLINKQSIFINSTNDRKNDINTNDTINQIFPYPLYPVPYPLQTFNNFTNPPTKQTYSHDHIIQAKYGIIQDCILINGGNNALIKNGIFYNSTNYGEVSGNAILNNSNNLGSNYTREAIIYSNNPVILNNSNNSARIYANTIFNSGSSNDYIVIGNTVFNQAVNNGTITGNAILNQSRNYGYIAGNAIFNSGQNIGYQVPDLYGPTAYRNVGGYIAGNAVFVSGSCNNAYATITGFIEQDGTSIDC